MSEDDVQTIHRVLLSQIETENKRLREANEQLAELGRASWADVKRLREALGECWGQAGLGLQTDDAEHPLPYEQHAARSLAIIVRTAANALHPETQP